LVVAIVVDYSNHMVVDYYSNLAFDLVVDYLLVAMEQLYSTMVVQLAPM